MPLKKKKYFYFTVHVSIIIKSYIFIYLIWFNSEVIILANTQIMPLVGIPF